MDGLSKTPVGGVGGGMREFTSMAKGTEGD